MFIENHSLGIFTTFWEGKHPHHLPLLHLRGDQPNKDWNLEISLQRIDNIFQSNERETILHDLQLLTQQKNWRPHLIFCISILKLPPEESLASQEALWKLLEEYNSWVIPQLAVTASIIDPDFRIKAINIIREKWQIDQLEQMNSDQILIQLSRGENPLDDKSRIAMQWKEKLLILMKEKKIDSRFHL